MKPRDLSGLEEEIGHAFRRRSLLEQALTHSSHAREQQQSGNGDVPGDNEQMEFLGDAVLGLVTSQELFEKYPQFHEGQLSKIRAHLVSERHLIRAAKRLHLGRYLRLGRGEEKSGGRTKPAILVDALEALVAAVYLDAGMEKTRNLILDNVVTPELKRLKRQLAQGLPITDYKSALQEAAHTASRAQPSYVLVKESGPEHRKTFTVEARLPAAGPDKPAYVGCGEGTTKKDAAQDAARQVLDYLWELQGDRRAKPRKRAGSDQAVS